MMRILFVVHGFPPAASGGTEIYAHDLACAFERISDHEVIVLAREAVTSREEFSVRFERRSGLRIYFVNNTFRACQNFEDTYRNPKLCAAVAEVLDHVQPDVACVQHLTCLSTDLLLELHRRKIPIFATLNDYWFLCHRGQLLDLELERCQGPGKECANCIGPVGWVGRTGFRVGRLLRPLFSKQIRGFGIGSGQAAVDRQEHMRKVLNSVTLFFAPSHTLRKRFMEFGIPKDRILHLQQGINKTPFKSIKRTHSEVLRLGFVGSLLASKAPHLLLEAFRGLPEGTMSLDFFGEIAAYHGDDSYRTVLEPLLNQKGIQHHNALPHKEIPRALAKLDVLIVPSVWLENAPFVISEAFAAGLPVVTANLGGMAEMVQHDKNGLLFRAGDAEDLRRTLQRFLDDPKLLPRLRAGLPNVMSIEEDAKQLEIIFKQNIHATTRRDPFAKEKINKRSIAAVVVNFRTPVDTMLACRSLQTSQRPVDHVFVVDNDSRDESADYLRKNLPGANLIQAERNLGFAGGCNLAIQEALEKGADFVFLLNADAMVNATTLGKLEHALESHQDAGIAGPIVLERSDLETVASTGIFFSKLTGRMHHLNNGPEQVLDDSRENSVVPAIAGCAMLIRREVFEKIGFLCEDFFFYFEDVDFCIRAADEGFKSIVVNDCVAYHQGGRSIGVDSPRKLYFATRNHLLVGQRCGSHGPLVAMMRSGLIFGLNIAHAITCPHVPTAAGAKAVFQGTYDFLRHNFGTSA
ncbi:MAG: glycosyltransferase [Pseudomonadota bacterium]